ncbi:MAG TPA: hypothetical protein ACFE0H_02605, partial [Elainellaceae cyanobacterium]
HWLAWLASKSESVFLIEEMQPSWLTKSQQDLHLAVNLVEAALAGLIFGLPYGITVNFYLLYAWGHTIGSPLAGIALGTVIGIVIGPPIHYLLKRHKLPIKTHDEVDLSFRKLREVFWNTLRRSIYEAAVIGLLVGLFLLFLLPPLHALIPQLPSYEKTVNLWVGILAGTFFGLISLILRLLSNSLVTKKEIKTLKPNQGILNSYKKAFLVGKTTSLISAIMLVLAILVIHQGEPEKLPLTIALGLGFAIITGPVAAVIHHSGQSGLQHLALRVTLCMTDNAPWNYARFLDYASELTFLNKIGGGYQFFHKLFQDYLASQKLNQS